MAFLIVHIKVLVVGFKVNIFTSFNALNTLTPSVHHSGDQKIWSLFVKPSHIYFHIGEDGIMNHGVVIRFEEKSWGPYHCSASEPTGRLWE